MHSEVSSCRAHCVVSFHSIDETRPKAHGLEAVNKPKCMNFEKREAEKARDREAKKRKRQNAQFREKERARDRLRHRLARQDENRRREEQARNTAARRLARQNAARHQNEQERNTAARRIARLKQQELTLQNPLTPSKDEDPHSYYLQVIQRIWNDARNHLDRTQMNKLVAECTAFVMSKTMEFLSSPISENPSNGSSHLEGIPSMDTLILDINHLINMACPAISAESSDADNNAVCSQAESVVCTPDISVSSSDSANVQSPTVTTKKQPNENSLQYSNNDTIKLLKGNSNTH